MIQYKCKYEKESWEASFRVIKQKEEYSILEIEYKNQKIEVFLWHSEKEYWIGIPKMEIIQTLSHPTDEFWNWEALVRTTHDEYFSKTIATGISKYYISRKGIVDIQKYIKSLHGRKLTYKTSVVISDPISHVERLICMINEKTDECIVLSVYLKTKGKWSVSTPFISDLNYLFDHCLIDANSPYLGKDIRQVIESLDSLSE